MLNRATSLLVCALALCGCDRSGGVASTSPAGVTTPATSQPVFGKAIIRGKVIFAADAPVRRVVSDGSQCVPGVHHAPILDESIIVNPNKTLRNAIVYLTTAPASLGDAQPARTLDQDHCQYVPHVIALQVGQPLEIATSDQTAHNVHVLSQTSGMNVAMTRPGEKITTHFSRPEFVQIKCDVHPWMNAWVGVFDHPFFAVTGEDGTFEIRNVPAGTYTIACWHEHYHELDGQTVQARDDAPAQVTFTYAP